MTTCPLLDLLPILEGSDLLTAPRSIQAGLSKTSFQAPEKRNFVAHQENNRRIVEWTRQLCQHVGEIEERLNALLAAVDNSATYADFRTAVAAIPR